MDSPTHKTSLATTAAAAALAVAGVTHFAASGEHRAESVAAAAFFAIVAVLQVVAAIAVLRGVNDRARNAIIVGNVALIALWAWSRTTGLQVGPDAGPREAVGLLDLSAVFAQVVAIALVAARSYVPGQSVVSGASALQS